MKKLFLLLLLSVSLSFTACQTDVQEQVSQDGQQSEKSLSVVTSFYPLAFLTQEIGGDKISLTNLAGNTEIHDFSLSPQDIIKIYDADLLIVQYSFLETWFADLEPDLKAKEVSYLEIASLLELHEIEDHEDEHHEDDHHEDEHHEDDHHGHDHGNFDPHTWLDPVLAQEMADLILAKLISVDPQNTDYYKQNASKLKEKLESLHLDFASALANCERSEVIVSHNAFGYIERRYGISLHPIAGLSTEDEPSAKLLAELKDEAEEGVSHILAEKNKVKKFANTLSAETGLSMLTVSSLETNEQEFFEAQRSNLQSFKTAFGCQ